MCFKKKRKLSPRYISPYLILKRVGGVAYELKLPMILGSINPVIHVSMFTKYIGDPFFVMPIENVVVSNSLSYEEILVEILDKHHKVEEYVSLVKVLWINHNVEEATWKTE